MRFSELDLSDPIAAQLEKRGINDEQGLREFLGKDHKGLHSKTRLTLDSFLKTVEVARQTNNCCLLNEFQGHARSSTMERLSKTTTIRTFPEEVADEPSSRLVQLEDAIEALFIDEPKYAEILRYRLGLQRVLPQTLEQIGERFGVTRERIRQIEAKKLKWVKRLFLQGSTAELQLHPDLLDFARDLMAAVDSAADSSVLTVDSFKANLRDKIGIAPPLRKGVMRLMLDWNNLSIASYKATRAFIFRGMKPSARAAFCQQLSGLEIALQRRLEPVHFSELFRLAPIDLEGLQMNPEDFLPLLDFEPEWLSEDVFQVPLGILKGRANQAVRVLTEWGDGLNCRDITERIRLAEDNDSIAYENLRNSMVADARLRPIGRSGIWVLAEWDHITTSSIKDVIAAVLSESDRPLSRDEIFDAVQKRRPCAGNSVTIILSSTPEFLLVGHDLYRYSPGSSAANRWNRETLGQWVEEYFAASATQLVRMKSLVAALLSRSGLAERSLAGMLGHHPALISQRDRSDRVFVQYRPGWRDLPPVSRHRPGLPEKVDSLLEDLLQESACLPLLDVVNLLSEELGSPVSSLYTYIRSSSVCQTYEEQGQRWICRPDDWKVPEKIEDV